MNNRNNNNKNLKLRPETFTGSHEIASEPSDSLLYFFSRIRRGHDWTPMLFFAYTSATLYINHRCKIYSFPTRGRFSTPVAHAVEPFLARSNERKIDVCIVSVRHFTVRRSSVDNEIIVRTQEICSDDVWKMFCPFFSKRARVCVCLQCS